MTHRKQQKRAVRDTGKICPHPGLQDDNIFVFIRQVAPVLACWLFNTSATSLPLNLTLKVVSESRVTWATTVSNFSLPRPLRSQVRPDVCDRQTSDGIIE